MPHQNWHRDVSTVIALIGLASAAPAVTIDWTPIGASDTYYAIAGFRVALVPEPGTGLLLAMGLLGIGWRRR